MSDIPFGVSLQHLTKAFTPLNQEGSQGVCRKLLGCSKEGITNTMACHPQCNPWSAFLQSELGVLSV